MRRRIVGYANQQALILASVGVRTIASGNFRNVRSFNPEIFDAQEESDRQRATSCYDAGTLSEFRIQTLQLAFRRGFRDLFGPSCAYCEPLLNAGDPSAVGWGEPEAFRHWLYELNRQWLEFGALVPSDRIGRVTELLESARRHLSQLPERGILPGERSFAAAFAACEAVLEALRFDRGASLRGLG